VSFDGRVAGLSKTFDLVATSLSGVRGEMKTRVEELSATLAEAEKQWQARAKVGIAQYPYPCTQTCSYTQPDANPIPITRQVKKSHPLTPTHTHTHTRTCTHRPWRGAVAHLATRATRARTWHRLGLWLPICRDGSGRSRGTGVPVVSGSCPGPFDECTACGIPRLARRSVVSRCLTR
jgi:hypothetical protein